MVSEASGILLVDKPIHLSSNCVLQRVRRILSIRKAGHTGTLDPLATGLLPICVGEATKFSQFLLADTKRYEVKAELGIRTDTADSTGQILEKRPIPQVSPQQLILLKERFLGEQKQVPPMFSALKHEGQPLYKLARKGVEITRKERSIVIHALENLCIEGNELQFTALVSKGTYIRTLVEDMASFIGTLAHVTYLRRVDVGAFSIKSALSFEQLEKKRDSFREHLIATHELCQGLPAVQVSELEGIRLKQGQRLSFLERSAGLNESIVQILTEENIFLGVGEISLGVLRPKRLLS